MKKTCVLGLGAVFLVSMVVTGWCAGPKIAVVNMGRLINAHPRTETDRSILEKQIDEFESEQKEMLTEFERLKKEFDTARKEAQDKALSEEGRNQKHEVAQDRLAALREFEFKVRETSLWRKKELADQKLRMRMRIVSGIRGIVQEYAAKKGFVLVLDCSSLGANGVETVVYNSQRIDITKDVIKLIKKE